MTTFNVYIETTNESFFVDSFSNKKEAIALANNPGPAYRNIYEGKEAQIVVKTPELEEPVYSTSL